MIIVMYAIWVSEDDDDDDDDADLNWLEWLLR